MKLLIFMFIIIFLIYLRNYKIKWKTFFRKGFTPERGIFGVYCYDGKQGNGKTYSVVEFLRENSSIPVYGNISSIQTSKVPNYIYFPSSLENLLKLRDKTDCIIVFDEIFTALTKTSKITTDVLDFLSQMRKRRIIFITTAQEWLEIPITLRRYCRFRVECKMHNFFGLGILIKKFYDAEQMKWSTLDNEYVAPMIETTISKCNICVANSYDTYEQINNNKEGLVLVEDSRAQPENEIADTTTISNFGVNGQDTNNCSISSLEIDNIINENTFSSTELDTNFWDDLVFKEDIE